MCKMVRNEHRFMITIIHGGQTGVDHGAHDAALNNGWNIGGYMPRNGRDELGKIPEEISRFLLRHHTEGLAARTEANVCTAGAVLLVVKDALSPRATPGSAKTLDLAIRRHLPRMIVDPATHPGLIARWIWENLLRPGTLALPLEERPDALPRLLVAGPRESKWPGARAETAALLRSVARTLTKRRS